MVNVHCQWRGDKDDSSLSRVARLAQSESDGMAANRGTTNFINIYNLNFFYQQLGLDETDVDLAFGDFIASKIVANGEPAPRLCNKDPFALKWTTFLAHSFPRARFVLMLRDGRAVAHSLMEHNLTHECVGTAKRSAEEEDTATEMFKHCLGKWNTEVEVSRGN
jgi:hypothetical protein